MSLIAKAALASSRARVILPSVVALLVGAATSLLAETAPIQDQPPELSEKAASHLVVQVVKPVYPPVAEVNYIQGAVRLEITVGPSGHVDQVRVIKGEALLAAAAIAAVGIWRYQPYIGPKGATAFKARVLVTFQLLTHLHRQAPTNSEEFLERQVRPPQVAARPPHGSSSRSVRLKVLVGAEGQILDAEPVDTGLDYLKAARNQIRRWKFTPAHWGALAVPWYLLVDVPLESPGSREDVANTVER